MGQDKGSLTEGKKHGGDVREITHHLPQGNQCPASLRAAGTLEGNSPLTFFLCFQSSWLSITLMMWTIPQTNSGQLSQLCALPISCPPHASHSSEVGGVRGGKKTLTLCKHCSATTKTPAYYQHCFSHRSKTQYHTGCFQEI